MYILISLHKRIKVGISRHELGIVLLNLPFVTIEVFPSFFNKQILDTFMYVHAGKKFVAVGSGEWNDTFDERTKVIRENWNDMESEHWKRRTELQKKLSVAKTEISTLKSVIKIVGGGDE